MNASRALSTRTRDALVLGALAVALLVVTVVATQGNQSTLIPLDSHSTSSNGAQAVVLWLKALGYPVQPLEYQAFELASADSVLIVGAPLTPFTDDELSELDAWVNAGGTLIVAVGPTQELFGEYTLAGRTDLLLHYDVSVHAIDLYSDTLTLAQPLLTKPLVGELAVRTVGTLSVKRADTIAHAYVNGAPVLVSFRLGKGTVWLTTLGDTLSNVGLHQPGNARLWLAIIGPAVKAGRVRFDEIHHLRVATAQSLQDWLWHTPPGWGVLLVIGALLLYLFGKARRFGRAVPWPRETMRRGPEEYISAMASLHQRGGSRDALARHYYVRLKRTLARRYRMDPTQRDDLFVEELGRYRPELDRAALLAVLTGLRRSGVAEGELLRLASAAERWVREAEGV